MAEEKMLLDRQAGRWAMLGGCILGGGGGGAAALGEKIILLHQCIQPLFQIRANLLHMFHN